MAEYRLICTIVSPIHIGTGEELYPFEYVVKNGKVYGLDLEKLTQKLSDNDKKNFESLCERGDLVGLRKFIGKISNVTQDKTWEANITSEAQNLYNSKINDPRAQLIINPTMRDPLTKKPLIPASSIKGAIRTAVISELIKSNSNLKNNLSNIAGKNLPERLEQVALAYEEQGTEGRPKKNLARDPFRAIKIADAFPEKSMDTTFARVFNYRPNAKNKLAQFNMIFEFIADINKSFETTMEIDEHLYSKIAQRELNLSIKFNLNDLFNKVYEFYRVEFDKEKTKFWQATNTDSKQLSLYSIESAFKNFKGDGLCVLRLGRFSQAEFVTVDGFRRPQGRQGK